MQPALRPTELALTELIERAYQARADLRAIYKQKEALRAEDRRLLREIVPNPLVSFDWQKDLDGQEFIGAPSVWRCRCGIATRPGGRRCMRLSETARPSSGCS